MQNCKKDSILVVDDSSFILKLISKVLDDKYTVYLANCINTALKHLEEHEPDLILLDIVMPQSGFSLCKIMQENKKWKKIPVIFLTSLSDVSVEVKGLSLGAVDFITKPFNPILLKQRIKNHLKLKNHRKKLEYMVQERTEEILKVQEAVILAMGLLGESRDNETGAHIKRTSLYVSFLLDEYLTLYPNPLFTEDKKRLLVQSVSLHDIGKVAIADSILLKTTSLTKEEFNIMKSHTSYGGRIIKKVEEFLGSSSFLTFAYEIAMYHHEYYDGSGYFGLKKEQIPFSARMTTIADIYDALTTKRTYKEAYSHKQAVEIMCSDGDRTSYKQFDPVLFDIFRFNHYKFNEIRNSLK